MTLQPILFTLLFVYVFGSAVGGTGVSYVQFVIPGLLVMNLTTSSMAPQRRLAFPGRAASSVGEEYHVE